MKLPLRPLLILLTLHALYPAATPAEQDSAPQKPKSELNWHSSLEKAMEESQRSGKPILMEIHGRPWCPPCVAQGEKIMQQPEFADWAKNNVVLLEIRVGEGYSKEKGSPIWAEQFRKHKLPGIPAAVMLTSEGERIGTIYPKPDIHQWIGAASNLLTSNALSKQSTAPDTKSLPFRITESNNISVPATLNGRIGLNLMFHTAVDSVSLTKETVERFPEIKLTQSVETETWSGSSDTRFGKATLALGGLLDRQVTVFESLKSGQGTDGKFGPEQLHAKAFAIDFTSSEIKLLPEIPQQVAAPDSEWQSFDGLVDSELLFVEANLSNGKLASTKEQGSADEAASGSEYTETVRFLLHSGYSGFGLLDTAQVAKSDFLQNLHVEKENELSDSSGRKVSTKLVRVPRFQFSDSELADVPMSYFDGSLGQQRFSLLGCDFLRRYDWVFDLSNDRVYFRANKALKTNYFIK